MRTVIRPVVVLLATLGAAACSDRVLQTEPDMRRGNRGNSDAALFSHVSAGGPAAGLRLVASGLVSPVDLVEAPDGTGRLFVVDQIGLIRIITSDGTLLPTPFLDVRSRMVALMPGFDERGLLGLAFHPNFATNGRFFVYYNAPPRAAGFNNTDRLSEFRAAPGANVADPSVPERIILEIDDPQFNHNGGTITFGPADGYLYWAIGDGGGANDVGPGHVEDWYPVNAGGNGQDIEHNLLGNILRIDVNGAQPYAIPPDNPFVGRRGLDEIWAYGLRNPYRMSFDMAPPHILLAGDAGQRLAEEVSVIVKGGNYGWNVKEGLYCFNAANNLQPLPSCPSAEPDGTPLLPPVIAYPNVSNPFVQGLGVTVIGGYVYRGDILPQFRGRYIFADFSEAQSRPDGRIFIAKTRDIGGTGLWGFQEIHFPRLPGREIGHYVKGFGQDLDGEVYILGTLVLGPSGTTGKVFQLTKVSGKP
jgi:glucose/arabinose dehydrogenase